jgi:hypothetical protein
MIRPAFTVRKRGYVDTRTGPTLPPGVASMSFRQGAKIGIGNVQDATRLFFTKEEVKQRWESRQERRIDSLGRWHVAAALRTGEVAVDVQLKDRDRFSTSSCS